MGSGTASFIDSRDHRFQQKERQTLSGLIKRSFSLAGHRTSVALEAAFWDVLHETARYRGTSLGGLVASVDSARDGSTALASALRILALREALTRVIRLPPATEGP
jgi:predicted DNA-binding ribbon-helix-helix protein